jgi:hypothetical protein
MLKAITILALTSFAIGLGNVASGHEQQNKNKRPAVENKSNSVQLKTLAEGFHSSITDPFVAVIRDDETYSQLRKMEPNLPKLEPDFFQSNVVVAAFLGERNTGGYSVEISREGVGGIRLVEKKPGKGMMVPQMITSPFKIVACPLTGTTPVVVLFEKGWESRLQAYHVTSGKFINSGGFAGSVEEYGLEGKISVVRKGGLATFSFLLKNAGETNEHLLIETATGIVESSGAITINRLSALTLVSKPNSGLRAKGRFDQHDHNLSLEFNPLPPLIADGFTGAGTIEATIIVSVPRP